MMGKGIGEVKKKRGILLEFGEGVKYRVLWEV